MIKTVCLCNLPPAGAAYNHFEQRAIGVLFESLEDLPGIIGIYGFARGAEDGSIDPRCKGHPQGIVCRDPYHASMRSNELWQVKRADEHTVTISMCLPADVAALFSEVCELAARLSQSDKPGNVISVISAECLSSWAPRVSGS